MPVPSFAVLQLVSSSAGFVYYPDFTENLQKLLAVCKRRELDFRASSMLRTPIVQAEYYCKWEQHPPALIDAKIEFLKDNKAPWLASLLLRFRDIPRQKAFLTGQLPGSSWHQWGLAADCYCYKNGEIIEDGNDPVYGEYASEAQKLGLTAGYYFKHRDAGHVQGPKENGASDVFIWKYIERVMKERFEEKTLVALRNDFSADTDSAAALDDMERPEIGKREPGVPSTATVPTVPPEAQEKDIKVIDGKMVGPEEIVFGKFYKGGVYNIGRTTINEFFEQDPDSFPDISNSVKRVLRAVSQNEGNIEAINTYDKAFLSCGVFQWTAGVGEGEGELAGLLEVLKARSPTAFDLYYGRSGLDVEMVESKAKSIRRGYLTLNGIKLDMKGKKKEFSKPIWAYRFWRASHDVESRRAQIQLAMQRIDVFYSNPIASFDGKTLADLVSSEYAVALLLDEHVNRPGHVPGTILDAIQEFMFDTKKKDFAKWDTKDEKKVIKLYIKARNKTNMTDPADRAQRIKDRVSAGDLSNKRSSFTV